MRLILSLALLTSLFASPQDSSLKQLVESYAEIAYRAYSKTYDETLLLETAVRNFTENPTEQGLLQCRQQWIKARWAYSQTEVFRFYDGPIDGPLGLETRINAWPIDEAFIDYVQHQSTGIISSYSQHVVAQEFPSINAQALIELNNNEGGEQDVCVGFHALEFLLWGQDLHTESAGTRPLSDFTSASHAHRRCQFLQACSSLLSLDIVRLVDAWTPDRSNYRQQFLSDPPTGSLRKAIKGMSMLSGFELAGERLAVPYDTQFQEDEHSCFSDTTHYDLIYNIKGLQNLWFGQYEDYRTLGLHSIAPPDLSTQISAQLNLCEQLAKAIPEPFDQAILGADDSPNRIAILSCIRALEHLSSMLSNIPL